jgi:hypothetical protein
MRLYLLGIALLTACTTVCAQTQSGSSIGADSPGVGGNVQPRPLPPTSPSTGTSAPSAGTQGTSQRLPETSVGTSAASSGSTMGERSSGLCDTLIGEDRTKCMREQATTGTAGAGSAGGSAGGGLK